jgi:hypothetical protein
MRALPISLFACVSCFGTMAAQARANEQAATRDEFALITRVSADPFAPSGVLATAVEISAVSEGVTATYYIPYMSVRQAKPQMGQTCKLSWSWHGDFDWVTANGSVRGVRLVTKFDCGGG